MAYRDPDDPRSKEAKRRYYLKNKGRYLAYANATRERYKRIVRRLKRRPCADCGRRYPYYVMDFDHRDGALKEHEMAKIHFRKSRAIIEREAGKCDLVCANCHRIRTHRREASKKRAILRGKSV